MKLFYCLFFPLDPFSAFFYFCAKKFLFLNIFLYAFHVSIFCYFMFRFFVIFFLIKISRIYNFFIFHSSLKGLPSLEINLKHILYYVYVPDYIILAANITGNIIAHCFRKVHIFTVKNARIFTQIGLLLLYLLLLF